MCSTPEGVTDWITTSPAIASLRASQCSTPEGVTDWITTTALVLPALPVKSAQRPKASLIGSPGTVGLAEPDPSVCSTPEGVTDWITEEEPVAVVPVVRCSTPEGVTDWITQDNLERLWIIRVLNARRRH